MPGYKWLFDNKPLDISEHRRKMESCKRLGSHTDAEVTNAKKSNEMQSQIIEDNLHADPDFVKSYEDSKRKSGCKEKNLYQCEKRNCSLIAYIQRLGTDIK
jgi:cytochrome c oxidase cbb3-type subunit I/II